MLESSMSLSQRTAMRNLTPPPSVQASPISVTVIRHASSAGINRSPAGSAGGGGNGVLSPLGPARSPCQRFFRALVVDWRTTGIIASLLLLTAISISIRHLLPPQRREKLGEIATTTFSSGGASASQRRTTTPSTVVGTLSLLDGSLQGKGDTLPPPRILRRYEPEPPITAGSTTSQQQAQSSQEWESATTTPFSSSARAEDASLPSSSHPPARPRPTVWNHPCDSSVRGDASVTALWGALAVACSVGFSTLGASYGITKAGLGVIQLGTLAPHVILRGIIPVVMAELLAIYGFISALQILMSLDPTSYVLASAYLDLGAGLTVGLSGLVSGVCIGVIGDANNRGYGVLSRNLQFLENPGRAVASPSSDSTTGRSAFAGDEDGSSSSSAAAVSAATKDAARMGTGRAFTAMILMLIFAEGLGLYGMIIGVLLHNSSVKISENCSNLAASGSLPSSSTIILPCGLEESTLGAFFGCIGVVCAIGFATFGAAFGIAKSGVGLCHLGIRRPDRLSRGITPIVMSELLAIYGIVSAIMIALGIASPASSSSSGSSTSKASYSLFSGYIDLSAGLAVGCGCLAAGFAIGIVGDVCVRAYGKYDRIFVAMVLMLIFAEALGLYGMIVALVLHGVSTTASVSRRAIPINC